MTERASVSDKRSRDNPPKISSPLLHQNSLGYSSTPDYTTKAVENGLSVAGGNHGDQKYPPHKLLSAEAVAATLPPLLEPDLYRKAVTGGTEKKII